MPRYYCDYCDTYLTHDSPSVRKQHNAGYKHKANVRTYYQQFEEQQTQSLIDQRIKEHLGQAAALHQVGAPYAQQFMALQANAGRPRGPLLPPPMMYPTGAQAPLPGLLPGVRPPVLARPGVPGFAPGALPSMVQPGATSMPMPMSSLPMPPMLNPPVTVGAAAPASGGAAPAINPVPYPGNPSSGPSAGAPGAPGAATPSSQGAYPYAQASESSH